MTKSEIKSIMKQIERLKDDIGIGEKRQIEDLTEVYISIFGMDYMQKNHICAISFSSPYAPE